MIKLKFPPKFFRIISLFTEISLHFVFATTVLDLTQGFSCKTEFFPKLYNSFNVIFFSWIRTWPSFMI